MQIHIHCTSCLSPNTSIKVALSDFHQRLEQTQASLLRLRAIENFRDLTIFLTDISSAEATFLLFDYCEENFSGNLRFIPLPINLSQQDRSKCECLGKGYSEILMLKAYSDYLSTLSLKSHPDLILKVGARTLPSNLKYLLFLCYIFRNHSFYSFIDRRYLICETRCFALTLNTLNSFLDSSYILQINDLNDFYIEHALYQFVKHQNISSYPIPFIPLYSSLYEASAGQPIAGNLFIKFFKFLLFGKIV